MTIHSARLMVAGAVFLVAVGCGVPSDESYQPVPPAQVPFGLADTTTTSTTTTTRPPATTTTVAPTTTTTMAPTTTTTIPTEEVALFYVLGSNVVRNVRPVPSPVSIEQTIAELERGPQLSEKPVGTRSSLQDGMVRDVRVTGGVAYVDLEPTFLQLPGPEQQLGFAQLVLTLTERPGIGQVRFTTAGTPQQAFLADGSLAPIERDLVREDYVGLLAAA